MAVAAGLAVPGTASSAPAMCTGHGTDPRGVVATHLYAKVDGAWIEPRDLCVGVRVDQRGAIGSYQIRDMYLNVWHASDPAYPETKLPPGTLISLGVELPAGMFIERLSGGWPDGRLLSEGQRVVLQGSTTRWDYHHEAYFGAGLDCSLPPVVWPSTFGAYVTLNPIDADGTPVMSGAPYGGAIYGSNSMVPVYPRLLLDENGTPTGVEVAVEGCGDGDPATNEGFLRGFTPAALFHAWGIGDALLRDAAVLQELVEVRDLTTGAPVPATFGLVAPDELALEPVPGVVLPSPPAGSKIAGVRTTADFSYSAHRLVQRGKPSAMRALRRCRSRGGRPVARAGELVCIPDTRPPRPRLLGRSVVHAGKAVRVLCDEPCDVAGRVVVGRTTLASGRRKSSRAGTVRLPLRLTAAGRRLASGAAIRAVLRVTVTDRAGNRARRTRAVRLVG